MIKRMLYTMLFVLGAFVSAYPGKAADNCNVTFRGYPNNNQIVEYAMIQSDLRLCHVSIVDVNNNQYDFTADYYGEYIVGWFNNAAAHVLLNWQYKPAAAKIQYVDFTFYNVTAKPPIIDDPASLNKVFIPLVTLHNGIIGTPPGNH